MPRPRPYLRHPSIAAGLVVFVAEDDVWCVPIDGGRAVRCTAGDGVASFPRLSPDGGQIAYTRQDNAGHEVWVVDAGGGEPRQLTWLGGIAWARGWAPDGRIVFTSDAQQPFRQTYALHAVAADGDVIERLPYGPARDVAWAADGTVALGRNTADPARWKRNRGGAVGKLWIDRGGKGRFRPVARDVDGDLASPMLLGGRLWFLSDHEGQGSLYSCRLTGADLRRHRHEGDFYSRWATTDGERIVCQRAGDIWVFDPATERDALLEVDVPLSRHRTRRRRVKAAVSLAPARPAEQASGLTYALDHTGEQVAMEARGRVVAFRAFDGPVRVLGAAGRRQRLPRFLPDGAVLLVADDGEQRLEVHGDGQVRRLAASIEGRIGDLAVSPSGDHAAAATHRGEIVVVDLAADTATVVDDSEHGLAGAITWSPDGRWLAYSRAATGDYIRQIRLYDVAAGTRHDVTRPEFGDGQPSFDPTGQYLYFVSARAFEPSVGVMGFELFFARPMQPYVLTLNAATPPPFADDSAFTGQLSRSMRGESPDEQVDVERMAGRIRPVPVEAGRYSQLIAVADGLVLRSDPIAGSSEFSMLPTDVPARSALLLVKLNDGSVTTLADGVTDVSASADRRWLLVRHARNLRRIAVDDGRPGEAPPTEQKRATGWVALDRVTVPVEPPGEWRQIFDEAWRLMAEFFWRADMGGVDWTAARGRFEPLLERVACRADLSDLIWEMYGELGVGHCYEFGGDYVLPDGQRVGHLGADLRWDPRSRAWVIDRILAGDPWDTARSSPLVGPGLDVAPGDRIVAVDGEAVGAAMPPARLLAGRAGEVMELTLRRGRTTKSVEVTPLADERATRYRDWVSANRARVHAETDGRVGYIHLPNMGMPGFGEFHRAFFAEFDRDALVVDVRFNEGGFVSTLVLEKLLRRRIGATVYRWRRNQTYPRQAVSGVIVGLCNEHTGSDGDLFAHAFRHLDLGPLVGVRTWGGVIGIHLKEPHADGTITAQPELAHWFPDVGFGIEGHGAEPTHEVDVHPGDEVENRDRQLDRALELAKRALARARPFGPG